MMRRSRQISATSAIELTVRFPTRWPTFSGSFSKMAAIVMLCSAKDRRACDRAPEPARPDERDVVLALCAEDLPDLVQQRVRAVADSTLAEAPECRQVAPDLGRVDVRVLRDLL
jgi:hypothetical protein